MYGLFFLGKVSEIMVAHNHNISKILNTPTSLLPWEHKIIKNAFDEETVNSLLEVFNTINWDNVPKDDFEDGIQAKWISQDFVELLPQSPAKDVLQELNGWATHELLLQHYNIDYSTGYEACLLYTSPSPRDQRGSRMPSSA